MYKIASHCVNLLTFCCVHCRMYSILEFPEEGLVGIVAHCWTYEEDGVGIFYF